MTLSRVELLTRVSRLVERCRLQSAYTSGAAVAELFALEAQLAEIEAFHAETINTYMAGLYRRHNVPMIGPQTDSLQPALTGRWGGGLANWRKRRAS